MKNLHTMTLEEMYAFGKGAYLFDELCSLFDAEIEELIALHREGDTITCTIDVPVVVDWELDRMNITVKGKYEDLDATIAKTIAMFHEGLDEVSREFY